MHKPAKTVLITDLDNTLFDWVALWYACFGAMFDKIIEISGLSERALKEEIRKIHQKHRTSEYSFLIEELPSLREKFGQNISDKFSQAIEAYQVQRRANLKLYPTVAESLLKIKGTGAKIVGYTESMAFYSNYRVRRLGLDGIFDFVFSPKDHELPKDMTPEEIRKYTAETYQFRWTKAEHTPAGELKPNKHVLLSIIQKVGATADECIYVGDSLVKDVAMARDAGVADAWAKYGQSQETKGYQLLREVTHWSDADVERERKAIKGEVTPSVTLTDSFSELLDHFRFGNAKAFYDLQLDAKLDAEERKSVVEIWKEVIDVQQHFNDLSMRIRGLFITLILALFAATGFLLEKSLKMKFGTFAISYATIVPLLGVIGTWLFYFIDRHWYHRLLIGSVIQGSAIEEKYKKTLPELALTSAIGNASPLDLKYRITRALAWICVNDERSRSTGRIHSTGKIELFYKPIIYLFLILAIVLAVSGGISFDGKSPLELLGYVSAEPQL